MKLQDVLKRFDRFLFIKKKIDGTIEIYRKSQFNKKESFLIKELTNQYPGSGKGIVYMFSLMDSRKFDFIMSSLFHNRKLQQEKTDRRIHQEVAEFMSSGEKIVA